MLPLNTRGLVAAMAGAALAGVSTAAPTPDVTRPAVTALDRASAEAAAAAAAMENDTAAAQQEMLRRQARETAGTRSSAGRTASRSAERSTERTRPATGTVTSPYGMRPHPISGAEKLHSGTDFEDGDGNAYAAASGEVESVEYDGGYGNMVTVDHGGGVQTRYAHLAETSVEVGERVDAGAKVGRIGSTGSSTGPHLHFEVREDGEFIDPEGWLAR